MPLAHIHTCPQCDVVFDCLTETCTHRLQRLCIPCQDGIREIDDAHRAAINAVMTPLMSGGSAHYLLDGHTPVRCYDFVEWAQWEHGADRHVAEDRGEGWWLSTVFLGHALCLDDSPPLLFETALFAEGHLTNVLDTYATWEEALHGHRVFLGKVPFLLASREEERPDE